MKTIGLAMIIAVLTVNIWTHPVLVSLERYVVGIEETYSGPLGGVAEEKAAAVELSIIDDVDPTTIRELIEGGLTCNSAATYLCNNYTAVSNVAVQNVTTWWQGNSRYCAARCKVNSDFYAFVVLVNEGPPLPGE